MLQKVGVSLNLEQFPWMGTLSSLICYNSLESPLREFLILTSSLSLLRIFFCTIESQITLLI